MMGKDRMYLSFIITKSFLRPKKKKSGEQKKTVKIVKVALN